MNRLKPHNKSEAGYRVKATKSGFPILQGMSLYRLTLNPKGIREPHWHANADELGYCLKGEVLVSIYGNNNEHEQILVQEGDTFFIPSGALHAIENVGVDACDLVLQFSHEEPEDFGISSAFGEFSDAVLGNTWDASSSVFQAMKRSTKDVFAVLSTSIPQIPEQARHASAYRFSLDKASPLIEVDGGFARVARKNVWPILHRQALYSLDLKTTGMREPHWHPETAELGFVKKGKGRMSILSPNGDVDTYEMQEGDVYFIPKAYPHHIENIGSETLQLMIFFDQPMPGDVGFTASVRSYADEVMGPVLGVSPQFFKDLPKYYLDQFIVNKKNPT